MDYIDCNSHFAGVLLPVRSCWLRYADHLQNVSPHQNNSITTIPSQHHLLSWKTPSQHNHNNIINTIHHHLSRRTPSFQNHNICFGYVMANIFRVWFLQYWIDNTTLQGTTFFLPTAKNAMMVSVNGGHLLEMVAARSKLEMILRSGCFHPTYIEVALVWHSCCKIVPAHTLTPGRKSCYGAGLFHKAQHA